VAPLSPLTVPVNSGFHKLFLDSRSLRSRDSDGRDFIGVADKTSVWKHLIGRDRGHLYSSTRHWRHPCSRRHPQLQ